MNADGFREFQEAVSGLEPFYRKWSAPFIRDALDKAAKVVAEEARARAKQLHDQGHSPKTPNVYENIVVRRAVVSENGLSYIRVGVAKKVAYAIPLEYGHILRTKTGYKHVAARPFMVPAFEAKRAEALAVARAALKESIPDMLKRAALAKMRREKRGSR